MPWFRVDDGFHSHPKVIATSLSARGLWVTAGSWSSDNLTDGVIEDHVLASLGGTPELARELVAAGLWRRRRNGYVFHDWLSKNPSRKAVENERANAAERQRRHRSGSVPIGKEKTGAVTPVENPGSPENPTSRDGSSRRDTPVTHGVTSAAPTRSSYGTSNGRASPASAARPKPRTKPPWCGLCDEQTRLTGPADAPYRCPACHPITAESRRL